MAALDLPRRARRARPRSRDRRPAAVASAGVQLAGITGKEPGDPRKGAAAILTALDAPDTPLRLALGNDAVDAIRAKHDRLRDDLDRWEALSRDSAFAA
jgi:hypothetical protein